MKTGIALSAMAIIFVLFSWILFLREELELIIIGLIYPQWNGFLRNSRSFFLTHGLNTGINVLFGGVMLGTFALYLLALRQKIKTPVVVLFAILFQVLVFFSYPILSTDIYDYILVSREATVYHQNVWSTPALGLVDKNDPFYALGRWKFRVSPYGLTHHAFYNLFNRGAGNDFMQPIVRFKILALLFGLATILLVYKLLKKYFPERLNTGLVLLFWNPLFVWDIGSSAHNNILMVFFMLLGYYLFLGKKYILAGLALGAATQLKYIPTFLAIFLGISLLLARKRKQVIHFFLPFILVNLFSLWEMGPGAIAYLTQIASGTLYYWQSLAFITYQIFPAGKILYLLGFILLLLFQTYRGLFKKVEPMALYTETLLIYLLFLTSFYWNWYVLWVLPFVIFFPINRKTWTILLFTLTSSLAHPLYWILLRFYPYDLFTQVIIYGWLVLPPTCYYLYARFNRKV